MNFTQDQTDADQTALTAGALTQLDDLIHRLAPSQEMVQKLENGFQDVARVRGW